PDIGLNPGGFYVRSWATQKESSSDSDKTQPQPSPAQPQLPPGWVSLDLNNITPPSWRIKGIMPETGGLILPGVWGASTTSTLLDMSYSLMTGKPFAGVYKVTDPCAVMMYALEGQDAIDRRMLAATGLKMGEAPPLPFYRRGECPALTN